MYMVVEVMVMEVSIPTVITPQGQVTSVGDNPHHTTNATTHIDISHMLHGAQEVMALGKITVVLEDVKVSLLYMNSTDKY